MKKGLTVMGALLVLVWVLAGVEATAEWRSSPWQYHAGDLSGTSNVLEAIDELDARLDNYGLSSSNAHFRPPADDTYDLGTSSLEWRNAYIDGLLSVDAVTNSAAIALWQTVQPGTDDSWDLGAAAAEWQDGYFDGLLSVDGVTNSVTIELWQMIDGQGSFGVTNLGSVQAAEYRDANGAAGVDGVFTNTGGETLLITNGLAVGGTGVK